MYLAPGEHFGLPAEDYFRFEAASNSGLKQILISPAHYAEWRERDEGDPTEWQLIGTGLHTLVLEGGEAFLDEFAITPPDADAKKMFLNAKGQQTDYWARCDSFKEWVAVHESEGRQVLARDQAKLIKAMGLNIIEHPAAQKILEACDDRKELTLVWEDEEFAVPCKCRFDGLAKLPSGFFGVDLKTVRRARATKSAFARQVAKLSYHMQARHYDAGHEAVFGERLAGWLVIVVEKEPPHAVAVYQFSDEWLWAAWDDHRFALERYAEWYHGARTDNSKPPAYPDRVQILEPPPWL